MEPKWSFVKNFRGSFSRQIFEGPIKETLRASSMLKSSNRCAENCMRDVLVELLRNELGAHCEWISSDWPRESCINEKRLRSTVFQQMKNKRSFVVDGQIFVAVSIRDCVKEAQNEFNLNTELSRLTGIKYTRHYETNYANNLYCETGNFCFFFFFVIFPENIASLFRDFNFY